MEIAKLIENEDGVAAAVDAFHRHLPPEIPLPRSLSQEDDHPGPLSSGSSFKLGNYVVFLVARSLFAVT